MGALAVRLLIKRIFLGKPIKRLMCFGLGKFTKAEH